MNAIETHRPKQTPAAVVILTTIAVCLPILGLSQFVAHARVDDPDAMFFAYCGKQLATGGRLYVDIWDNKPPGIFWSDAVALWLANGSYVGVVVLCSLAVAGTWVMFFLTAWHLYGLKVAAIGTVMAALYIHHSHYYVGGNRPSTFYVLFELCVLFFYCRSFAGGASVRINLFAAGVCAAVAVCFRQTAFSAAAAIVAHQVFLVVTKRREGSSAVQTLWPMVAGTATVVAGIIGVLWWRSDPSEAWWAIVGSNVGYVTASKQSQLIPELFGVEGHVAVLGLPLILVVAAIIHSIGTRIFGGGTPVAVRDDGTPPAAFALLAIWLPIALYLALVGPGRAIHYYGVALPPLLMLATHGVWLLLRREDASRAPRFYVILAMFWFGYMAWPAVRWEIDAAQIAYTQRYDDRTSDRYASTVEAIHRHTRPDERIFIWFYQAELYWSADRPLAHRYVLDFLIDQWHEEAQPYVDEVVSALKANPPKAMVASRRDMRMLKDPPDGHPVDYGDAADWIRSHYTVATDSGRGDVWIRNE